MASAAAPSLFGASTPAFGASNAPSLFGSAPALGAASSPSLFGTAPASAFGAARLPMFGGGAGAAAPSPFGGAVGPPQGLITYSTRYEDLPPERQRELQEIQREIGSYREVCEKLDRDPRLQQDSAAMKATMKKSMEEETANLRQSLQGMLNSIRSDDEALANFREKVLTLLRSTEYAVRTYQRARLWRDAPQQYKGQIMPAQIQEMLSSPVLLPSPYIEMAIQGFQQTLENYRQVIGELEQALPSSYLLSAGGGLWGGASDEASVIQALPLVISHMHDFFVHVAAQLEKLHQYVQKQREAYAQLGVEFQRHVPSPSPRPSSGFTPGGVSSYTRQNQSGQGTPMGTPTPPTPVPLTPQAFGTPFFR